MENSTLQQYEPELNNSSLSIERTYPTPLLYKQCNLIDLRLVCAWSAPGTVNFYQIIYYQHSNTYAKEFCAKYLRTVFDCKHLLVQ